MKFHLLLKNLKKFDAFIALGCGIKGETPHLDLYVIYLCAILDISNYEKLLGNGIITALNLKQAKKGVGLSKQKNQIKDWKLLKQFYPL